MRERDGAPYVSPLLVYLGRANRRPAGSRLPAAPIGFLRKIPGPRIAPLDHKSWNRPMKPLTVVEPRFDELHDVLDRQGRLLGKRLEGEGTNRRLDDNDRRLLLRQKRGRDGPGPQHTDERREYPRRIGHMAGLVDIVFEACRTPTRGQ